MNHNLKLALAIASVLGSVTPASAQGAPPQNQAKPADPMSEIVCQKQEVVGSRLATRRVCLTRLQWLENRTMDRQNVERAQIHPDRQKPGG